MKGPPTLADVRDAAGRIAGHVRRTPLVEATEIGERVGCDLRLKAECLQRAGAFKIRGALSRVLAMDPPSRARGLVAFSSGNHAQAVALAARIVGTRATIAMPADSMPHKVEATRALGAEVVTGGVTTATRDAVAREIAARTGATVIPPFDDFHVVAGQGTVGLEIVDDWTDVETVVVPTGGGGLLSGVALAATTHGPHVRVFGVEPEAGDDARRSLRAGRIVSLEAPPRTIADGARTLAIGEIPFAIVRERVADIVTVSDDALLRAVRQIALSAKLVVEPTGALAVAALLEGKLPATGRTVAVLSGGNVAPEALARALAP
jgi:threonine dehydratase